MTPNSLFIPAQPASGEESPLTITPESAGWTYCGLRIVRLRPGEQHALTTGAEEIAVLPLAGSVIVEVDGHRFELEGRRSVFARVSDWAYLPIAAEARLSSADGAELALASARAERRFEPAYVAAADVPIEIRGAGQATRQITNFLAPGAFDAVDRLICCEVLTPEGNWSSYPPHKHDDTPGSLANNEEIYYFRVGRDRLDRDEPRGFRIPSHVHRRRLHRRDARRPRR